MKRLILSMSVVLALVAVLASSAFRAAPASAQEGPDIDQLIQVSLEDADLPAMSAIVRLLYINMEPSSSNPVHRHPGGPEIWRVEAGTVTVRLQGPGIMVRDGESQGTPDDSDFQLTRGDQLTILPGTAMQFSNEGEEPVRILAVVALPYGPRAPQTIDFMGSPTPIGEDYSGVRFTLLGDGDLANVPSGTKTITVERIRLQPGEPIPAESNPNLLTVARGSLEFTVAGGDVQEPFRTTSQGITIPAPLIEPGTAVKLARYDAVFFPHGIQEAQRGDDQADITLYRVIVAGEAPEATPATEANVAVLSVTGPIAEVAPTPETTPEATTEAPTDATAESTEEATTEPTATSKSGKFADGQTVYVNDSDVRLRDAPTTDSKILTGLTIGQELEITGESVEADDITWWPVSSPDGESFVGWVAEQFLSATPVT